MTSRRWSDIETWRCPPQWAERLPHRSRGPAAPLLEQLGLNPTRRWSLREVRAELPRVLEPGQRELLDRLAKVIAP